MLEAPLSNVLQAAAVSSAMRWEYGLALDKWYGCMDAADFLPAGSMVQGVSCPCQSLAVRPGYRPKSER